MGKIKAFPREEQRQRNSVNGSIVPFLSLLFFSFSLSQFLVQKKDAARNIRWSLIKASLDSAEIEIEHANHVMTNHWTTLRGVIALQIPFFFRNEIAIFAFFFFFLINQEKKTGKIHFRNENWADFDLLALANTQARRLAAPPLGRANRATNNLQIAADPLRGQPTLASIVMWQLDWLRETEKLCANTNFVTRATSARQSCCGKTRQCTNLDVVFFFQYHAFQRTFFKGRSSIQRYEKDLARTNEH